VVISRLAVVHFADFTFPLEEPRVVDGRGRRRGQGPYRALLGVGKHSAGPVVGDVEGSEVSRAHTDRYGEQCPYRQLVCVRPGQLSAQVIDAQTLADRQIAESPRCIVVDSGVDERDQRAVGPAYPQGSVRGIGKLDRRIDDSAHCRIEVEVRTNLDDRPHQSFHLVASCH
jgi:hypothetical protein